MSSNTGNNNNNHKSGHAPELTTDYVCISEDEAVVVFEYLNGANDGGDGELVLAHLALCFDCQEAAAVLMSQDEEVRRRLIRLKAELEPVLMGG